MEIELSNGAFITNPEERVREYCRVEVYRGYDDCHDISDIVTQENIRAANRLFARIGETVAKRIMQSPHIRCVLSQVPNTNLGEMGDPDWELCSKKLRDAFGAFCSLNGVGIAVTTKILHLKRPELIPIIDSFVAKFLLGREITNITNKRALASIGVECTDVVRQDIRRNAETFAKLQARLSDLTIPLTKVRLYDILAWSTEKWDVRGDLAALYGTPKASVKGHPYPSSSAPGVAYAKDTDTSKTQVSWREIKTLEGLREAVKGNRGYIVITDSANPNKIHRPICSRISENSFEEKVIKNKCRNGHYYWVTTIESANRKWAASECGICL